MKERGDIPETTEVALVSDQSHYIRTAMSNLYRQVGLGAILVAIVVYVFLRRFLPTLIIVAIIGLAILIGGLGFAFTGQTINVMTLGGIALAIGTVVDAGIVVVENIIRHQAMGKSPLDAARDGTAEVSGAIFAGTATTLAVFLPAVFLTGMIHYLFTPLSLAATLHHWCIVLSGNHGRPSLLRDVLCESIPMTRSNPDTTGRAEGWYGRLLGPPDEGTGTQRRLVIVVTVGATFLLLPMIGSELFPEVDAGTFELRIKTVPGTELEATEQLVANIEETVKQVIPEEEIDALIANIGMPVGKGAGFSTVLSSNSGPDTAYLIVNLKQNGRRTSTQTYIERLREKLAQDYPLEQFLFVSGGIVNLALNEGVPVPISVQVSAGNAWKVPRLRREDCRGDQPDSGNGRRTDRTVA